MQTTNYTSNDINQPDETEFDYIIEVSAWHDTGTSEYIGIIGRPITDVLWDMLSSEVYRIRRWVNEESEKRYMEELTGEPEIAIVRERPKPDEDGDFPPSHAWPIVMQY